MHEQRNLGTKDDAAGRGLSTRSNHVKPGCKEQAQEAGGAHHCRCTAHFPLSDSSTAASCTQHKHIQSQPRGYKARAWIMKEAVTSRPCSIPSVLVLLWQSHYPPEEQSKIVFVQTYLGWSPTKIFIANFATCNKVCYIA